MPWKEFLKAHLPPGFDVSLRAHMSARLQTNRTSDAQKPLVLLPLSNKEFEKESESKAKEETSQKGVPWAGKTLRPIREGEQVNLYSEKGRHLLLFGQKSCLPACLFVT